MVMEVVHEDVGEGNMQCTNHPYRNSTPGGICAFCLQEKLGKLVSSSYPVAIFPSSSSSSSPSFRSAVNGSFTTSAGGGGGSGNSLHHLASSSSATSQNGGNDCSYNGRKSRLAFVLTHKKKKKKDEGSSNSTSIVFKRSKSTATPRRRGIHFLDENCGDDYSPNRRGFWSFLYLSKQSTSKKSEKQIKDLNFTSSTVSGNVGEIRSRDKQIREISVVVDENVSPDHASFDRKVSRSRSVGCGSRSFSGDFFERISTGFGDCTLRRVESQREGKPKMQSLHKNGGDNGQEYGIKERVKCGGIFSGFMIHSSSSSYLIESSVEQSGKSMSESQSSMGNHSHGRSKSWGWAFASPMRAFGKNSAVKRDASSSSNKNNATPNLAAIPSLLAVSG